MVAHKGGIHRVHILNQYIWPDAAPTGIYAEQLADRLSAIGYSTILVGGAGTYRQSSRSRPQTPLLTLESHRGRRGSHLSTLQEYGSIHRSFRGYIEREVRARDIVIVTSAPPSTITLHQTIKAQGAASVYWLQDYYPELLRGVWNYPRPIRSALQTFWAKHLQRWNHVVKAAKNLAYEGPNARVLRNWPTLEFPEHFDPEPRTALYSGNLGYGHDINRFAESCRKLHDDGYHITVRGDGPGISKLPSWINTSPPFSNADDLRNAFLRSEVHLVAAHPEIRGAIFPSKIWNSLAAGRQVVSSGFEQEMLAELNESQTAPFHRHLELWTEFVHSMGTRTVQGASSH